MSTVDPDVYPILLFDGVCNFCDHTIQWIIQHDQTGKFHFAPLQSSIAEKLLKGKKLPDSVVLIEKDRIYTESSAVLRICKHLDGIWKGLYLLIFVPSWIRNPVYRWFAKNRYRWFGKKEMCMIPSPEVRSRFLE